MALPTTERNLSRSGISQNVLEAILNAAREGILVVDASMRITAANTPARKAFSRQSEPITERRLSEIVRDPALHEGFSRTLSGNEVIDLRIEFTGVEKRTYDVHIAPVEIDGARHAIGVFYDITQVERLERVRQEFLSNISHELRTPLTSIIAYVETLQDGALDDPENAQRFLAIIRRNADRMQRLIADIAELSLIETGNISIDRSDIMLSSMIDEIFVAVSSKASERNVSLANQVPAGTHVSADPMRLEQMLTNLIDNGIKFNREGGTVTVGASESPEKTVISVSDTGEGIVPDNLQRIFERFYRIDRGRTRDVGGTGLGLAIVKHLARLHGGDVNASSRLGEGTTFVIELPRQGDFTPKIS